MWTAEMNFNKTDGFGISLKSYSWLASVMLSNWNKSLLLESSIEIMNWYHTPTIRKFDF